MPLLFQMDGEVVSDFGAIARHNHGNDSEYETQRVNVPAHDG
jgi:hypothetical protein